MIKYMQVLFLTLQTLFALSVDDIKNIEIEDFHVYYGGGMEFVDALEEAAINVTVGATAFAPNIHDLLVLEVTASFSAVPAAKVASSTSKAYETTIFNSGAYIGYLVESESPFTLTPKAGVQLVYASTGGFGVSMAGGITAGYELVDQNMIVFADYVLISGAQILSAGISMPFDLDALISN
jgi:hypothetical protein